VDVEEIAEVAAACLLDPKKHNGHTYRLGYEAATSLLAQREKLQPF